MIINYCLKFISSLKLVYTHLFSFKILMSKIPNSDFSSKIKLSSHQDKTCLIDFTDKSIICRVQNVTEYS